MAKGVKYSRKEPVTKLTRETIARFHRDSLLIKGHIIYPSSISMVKRYMHKAQAAGFIHNPREFTVGVTALLSAGMAEADQNKERHVKPRHIAGGWSKKLSVGGGNCPPNRCFESSVLRRLAHLKESLPYLSDLLEVMEDAATDPVDRPLVSATIDEGFRPEGREAREEE